MNDFSFLTDDTVFTILFAVLCVGFLIFCIVCISRSKNADKAARLNTGISGAEEDDWTPPEPIAYSACVVDMQVVVGNAGGHRRPETDAAFLVTFRTEDGEEMEYDVPEELYVTLEIGQEGTLVILNDDFFDFGSGDDYDEAAVEAFHETFGGRE